MGLELCHQRAHRLMIVPVEFPQKAFEIGKNRQVHGWRQALAGPRPGVMVFQKQLVQRVVPIGGNNHLSDWQAHLLRDVPRIDFGETGRRHAESDRPLTTAQLQHSVKIKHQLRHHADPVVRVETDRLALRGWPLAQQPGDDGLAIVKAAVHGESVQPGVSGSLQMLQLIIRHTGLRVEHHHGGCVIVFERLDGGKPGIPIGRPQHDRTLLAFNEEIVDQARLQLGDPARDQGEGVRQQRGVACGVPRPDRVRPARQARGVRSWRRP